MAHVASFTVSRGRRVILDSVSFSLPDRRATCIVGPGGSGKSTLLRALAGGGRVGPPLRSQGDVRVPAAVALCRQRPEHAAVTVSALLAGTEPGATAEQVVARAWTVVPEARRCLLDAGSAAVTELAPELRRLAEMTPVLASDVELVLLDEPDANASATTLEWMMTQLLETKARRAVVVATHHLRLARAVADEVLLLLDGSVVEHAPVETFFEHPATSRAASYVLTGS